MLPLLSNGSVVMLVTLLGLSAVGAIAMPVAMLQLDDPLGAEPARPQGEGDAPSGEDNETDPCGDHHHCHGGNDTDRCGGDHHGHGCAGGNETGGNETCDDGGHHHGHGCAPPPCEHEHRCHDHNGTHPASVEIYGVWLRCAVGGTQRDPCGGFTFRLPPSLGTDVVVIEVDWSPSSPLAANELRLRYPSTLENGTMSESVEGPPVLRGEVRSAAGGLVNETKVEFRVEGGSALDVAVEQQVWVAFSSFIDEEPPEGYSAFDFFEKP